MKPEPLKYALSGCWSRRINDERRLVYKVENDIRKRRNNGCASNYLEKRYSIPFADDAPECQRDTLEL